MSVTIRGSSDDLIEIEGDIVEEFNHYFRDGEEDTLYLAFSDGTALSVRYDKDGVWRFAGVAHGSSAMEKKEGTEDSGSDHVTLVGDTIRWVLLGEQFAKRPAKKAR